ncbi:MAG TPA: histidine kinase dimerization/phosphoacceptor domain -containing protein [Chthoniobacteraceae bacterium]|nr:histidine kinase dimerization/phosphoacceptor domain -containing protein [Chthoniobacteraceae bacterium]
MTASSPVPALRGSVDSSGLPRAGFRAVEAPLIVGYALVLLLLAGTAWFAIRAVGSLQRGVYQVDRTHEVVETLKELELDVREAESALRSYVLTGEASHLAEYRKQAFDELNEHAAQLRKLTGGNPEQLQRLDRAEPLLRARVVLLEQLRAKFAATPSDAVRQEIVALNTSRFTDPLVTDFDQFGRREQQLLSERLAERAAGAHSAIRLAIVSGVLGVVCVAAALFLVLRGLQRRRLTEAQLEVSLGEREILLKEVHHRVKNNLQVISSLLGLEAEKLSDAAARAVFKECRDRIHSMARLHQQLYARGEFAHVDFGAHLREMAEMLVDAHAPAGCQVTLSVHAEPLALDLDSAVTLGLVANEVLLNALKHAFTGRAHGVLDLRIRSGATREIVVCDDGVGLPPDFDPKRSAGLGLELIFGLMQQIHGSAKIENASGGGTCTTLAFPNTDGAKPARA